MAALTRRMLIAGTLIGGMLHCPAYADADDNAMLSTNAAVMGPFGIAPITSDALAAQRGGADVLVKNTSTLDGGVHDNQAYNLSTGSNVVTGGSFAGASGFSTVVMNTGNNVLIQNSTIINLQLQ